MTVSKFYIRYREDAPESEPQAVAERGFRERGVETVPFYWGTDIDEATDLGPTVGVAGYLGDVWRALAKLGVPRPPSLDYPPELQDFLGRRIERMPLSEARKITNRKMFVKPVTQKLFTGFVCEGTFSDQRRMGPYEGDEDVWVSDSVNFVSEYRCFVLRGEILDARRYKGDWGKVVDRGVVEAAVGAWTSCPVAYTLDFGVTEEGKTLLVEVNDGYAMGTYGLNPALYAQMLEARWEELVSLSPS